MGLDGEDFANSCESKRCDGNGDRGLRKIQLLMSGSWTTGHLCRQSWMLKSTVLRYTCARSSTISSTVISQGMRSPAMTSQSRERSADLNPIFAQTPNPGRRILGGRAVLYLRVSTGRQAEQELSIPDQRRQTTDWCNRQGLAIADEFVEAGASATDDRRPEFQRMVEYVCDRQNQVAAVIVHSFSRFMRDSFAFEFYVRRLAKSGVRVLSSTQDVGEDDPAQLMMRKVIALFDEYQSKENAKHVLRAMKENARQGFWNGARPPFGFRIVEAERRGERVKKRIDIDLDEAETVRLIFRLFLDGDGTSGTLGIKAIVVWLNERGYRTRKGSRWGVATIHKLLTNSAYAGQYRFNRVEARTGRTKPAVEQVVAEVPPIIDLTVFDQVQSASRPEILV